VNIDDVDEWAPTPRGRIRKDRRRWCRGKTGVEHQLAIRVDKYTNAAETCEMRFPGRRWQWWHCSEQEYCTACGKIMRHSLGGACTFRPLE
jgi:hypothetical protein